MKLKKYFEYHNGNTITSPRDVNNLPDYVKRTNPNPDKFEPGRTKGKPSSDDIINFLKNKKYPATPISIDKDGLITTLSFPMNDSIVNIISDKNKKYYLTFGDSDEIDCDQSTAKRIYLMASTTPDLL